MKYAISKSARLQVSDKREIITANSVSRTPKVLSTHVMFVFLFFLEPKTLEEALEELQEYFEFDRADFDEAVQVLIQQNILTPISQEEEPATLAEEGFANLQAQHPMLKDRLRVLAYKAAISRHVAGQTALEIGCGTGILSVFAAQAGAKKVIAIEESKIAELAKAMFAANGFAEKIALKRGNSKDIDIEEPVDVIIHEIIGNDPLEENMLPYIEDARKRFLKKGGRLIPFRLEILCRAIDYGNYDTFLVEASEFESIYGIRMGPYLDAIKKQEANRAAFTQAFPYEQVAGKTLSEECLLYDINLYAPPEDLYQPIRREISFLRPGHFNGVIIYFRAHLDEDIVLTSSPYGTRLSWNYLIRSMKNSIPVSQGTIIPVDIAIKIDEMGLERIRIEAVG